MGALLGGLGFVLPGFALMLFFSWLYSLIGLSNVYFAASFKSLNIVVAAMVARYVLYQSKCELRVLLIPLITPHLFPLYLSLQGCTQDCRSRIDRPQDKKNSIPSPLPLHPSRL